MKLKLQRIIAALFMLLLFAANLQANNITVSNISLTDENTTDKYVMVQFDLTWENSWRFSGGPSNWDAAWVFVKYRVGTGPWQHARLNNTGHTGAGATIDAGLLDPGSLFHTTDNPTLGVFIYRQADGTGTFTVTGAQLRWNYGANSVADNTIVDVKVFAVEMVYVPQGAFAAGSGGSESSAFTLTTINTANATTAPTGTGSLGGAAGGYPTSQTDPANASWPNGFGAFYCMKYEISQQQYVDFLNTLTYDQQNARVNGSPNAAVGTFTNNQFRLKIKIHTSGVASTTPAIYETEHPYVACNFLSWMDGAAYSDWAGLRPMTELEFEKACRGTVAPVANEYAWGTATVANSAYTLNNSGLTNEGIATNYSTTHGNASYSTTDGSIDGPLRVGIFAGHTSNNGRITAGATYWGIMEMSGNLWERSVTIGNVAGRSYTGIHGNGELNSAGHADQNHWPGINGNNVETTSNGTYQGTTGVTQAAGSGFRGGSWNSDATSMRASDRYNAAYTDTGRSGTGGFRAVRFTP